MPTYEYRCPECAVFDLICGMGEAPDSTPCPSCGTTARRKMSAPHLSRAGSTEFRLIDDSKRSAHEPQVVTGLSGTGKKRQAYTANPLHQKLPRP
jgi:putative FmdB family regulatory protein